MTAGMSSLYSREDCQPGGAVRITRRVEKFLLVGALGLGINLAALWLLHGVAGLPLPGAAATAILLSMGATFLLNGAWTWNDRAARRSLPARTALYFAINGVGMLINWQALLFLHSRHGVHYQLANLAGASMASVWNFLLNHLVTWRA